MTLDQPGNSRFTLTERIIYRSKEAPKMKKLHMSHPQYEEYYKNFGMEYNV